MALDRSADAALASRLAAEAGELLVGLRARAALDGMDGKAAGREGDLASNALILAGLAGARPDDRVLSEESADDPARLEADRVWIVDPLDGTREFGLAGRDDWAVHVALWERSAGGDGGITAAAVGIPALDLVMATEPAPSLSALDPGAPVRIVVSESRPPKWLPAFEEAFPHPVRISPLGSAGVKAMAVVRGEADAYLHDGGQYEWDSAAPVGVCLAAGLHASRLDGSPIRYNRPDPYLDDFVIARTEIAGELLAAVAAIDR